MSDKMNQQNPQRDNGKRIDVTSFLEGLQTSPNAAVEFPLLEPGKAYPMCRKDENSATVYLVSAPTAVNGQGITRDLLTSPGTFTLLEPGKEMLICQYVSDTGRHFAVCI